MALTPLTPVATPTPGTAVLPPSSTEAPGAFTKVLEHYLGAAGEQQVRSQQAVLDLALGRSDSLHGVVLEVAKADLAFRLLLEIRNRLTDAYQEVMKMQV
jgi:flagellar hook-basal body complex protein FliE